MAYAFTDVIASEAEFRAVMGEVPPPLMAKTLSKLDRHCRAFIARSPSC